MLADQVLLPDLESLSASRQEGVKRIGESGGSAAVLAACGLRISATKRRQNDARFAPRGASGPCRRGGFPPRAPVALRIAEAGPETERFVLGIFRLSYRK